MAQSDAKEEHTRRWCYASVVFGGTMIPGLRLAVSNISLQFFTDGMFAETAADDTAADHE